MNVDVINAIIINGLNTIAQGWLMAMFFTYSLHSKFTKNQTVPMVMGGIVLVEGISNSLYLPVLANLGLYVVVHLGMVHLVFQDGIREKGKVLLQLVGMDLVAELAAGLTFLYIMEGDFLAYADGGLPVQIGDAFFNLYFLCIMLIYFAIRKVSDFATKRKVIVSAILILVYQVAIVLLIFHGYAIGDTEMLRYGVLIFVSVASQVYCVIAILHTIVPLVAKKQKLEIGQIQQSMQLEQFRMTQDAMEQMYKLKHDFANHLQTIQMLSEQKQYEMAQTLLSQMKAEYYGVKEVYYCENAILNTILVAKTDLAKKKGISVDVSVGMIEDLNVPELYLSSLFSNLYDNAIEASRHMPMDRRWISIKIGMQKEHLVLKISNPYVEEINRQYPTQKSRDGHGYGLQIVREAVEHMGGNMNIDGTKDVFTVVVTIKV